VVDRPDIGSSKAYPGWSVDLPATFDMHENSSVMSHREAQICFWGLPGKSWPDIIGKMDW
jgi:hypothetical protein